mgnify:CR=1 FL=1
MTSSPHSSERTTKSGSIAELTSTGARLPRESSIGTRVGLKSSNTSSPAESHLNSTATVALVRKITYGMLMPYLEIGSFDQTDLRWISRSVLRCTDAFTLLASREILVGSEVLLRDSIESVLNRICSDVADIFKDTILLLEPPRAPVDSNATRPTVAPGRDALAQWRGRMGRLSKWLGWTEWERCAEVCTSSEVCTVPLWPVSRREQRRSRKLECAGRESVKLVNIAVP